MAGDAQQHVIMSNAQTISPALTIILNLNTNCSRNYNSNPNKIIKNPTALGIIIAPLHEFICISTSK